MKRFWILWVVLWWLPWAVYSQSVFEMTELPVDSSEVNPLDSLWAEETVLPDEGLTAGDSLLVSGGLSFDQLDSLYLEWRRLGFLETEVPCTEKWVDAYTVPDEVYRQRIADLPNVVPCAYNKTVRHFIELYAEQRRQQVSHMLAMSDYYFPIFEAILEENGLPLELKYLPIIESALNPNAVSKAGAAGLWQFMYSTGKMYGLQINSLTDERRDPERSTRAAVRFLQSLYRMFGDWDLAIAAYNCGPGNVRKAIARSGGQRDFWKIYYFLPRETRSYVPLFIAANYIMTYHEEHGICPSQASFSLVADTFVIRQSMHFRQISEVCGLPIDQLKKLNPHFRSQIAYGTESKSGVLYLPAEYTPIFIEYQDSIARYKKAEYLTPYLTAKPVSSDGRVPGEAFVYRVRSGDNLYNIARKYNVTIAKLRQWNNLKTDMLQVGQRLVIY